MTDSAASSASASDAVPAAAVVNLFGLDREALRAEFGRMGEAAYRADQVMQWIYRRGVDDFESMSNLSKDLRTRLAQSFIIAPPPLVAEQRSTDGTRKWVLRIGPGTAASGRAQAGETAIETVFIPEGDRELRDQARRGTRDGRRSAAAGGSTSRAEADGASPEGSVAKRYRGTLCISSQAGCAMDCSFCSTGKQGFSRNLSTAEIIAQVWFAAKTLGGNFQTDRVISNVVFMGMGEPLANYANVLSALKILLDDFGFGLSKRRVTVSTSGLVPFMDRLHSDVDTALAVSLHAPFDALRDELVPINRKYPLAELMQACRRYATGKDRKTHIVYEYVMLDGVNDRPEHARELAKLLSGMPAKINLIPFNPFPQTQYRRSKPEAIKQFSDILRTKGIVTTVRRTRGDDIDAACGQLVGRIHSRQKQRLGDIPVKVLS